MLYEKVIKMMDYTPLRLVKQEVQAYENKRLNKMELEDITDMYRELNHIVVVNNLDIDVVKEYQKHYNDHKLEHGTFRHLKQDYNKMMNTRYDYIFCCINEVLESKINYNRQQKNKVMSEFITDVVATDMSGKGVNY